jgi:hypothetical protein
MAAEQVRRHRDIITVDRLISQQPQMQVNHEEHLSDICQLIFHIPPRSVRRPIEFFA